MLAAFPPDLSASAVRQLEGLGVTSLVNELVVDIDATGVELKAPDGTTRRVGARTVDLGGGRRRRERRRAPGGGRGGGDRPRGARHRRARPHAPRAPRGDRARRHGAGERRRRRRPGPSGRRAGGDAAGPLRGRASVKRRLAGKPVKPFRYIDKGNLATIGRARAVAEIKGLHFGGAARLAAVARDPHLLPDRIPEPDPGPDALVVLLPHPRARRAPDHGGRRRAGSQVGVSAPQE